MHELASRRTTSPEQALRQALHLAFDAGNHPVPVGRGGGEDDHASHGADQRVLLGGLVELAGRHRGKMP